MKFDTVGEFACPKCYQIFIDEDMFSHLVLECSFFNVQRLYFNKLLEETGDNWTKLFNSNDKYFITKFVLFLKSIFTL